MKDGKLGEFLGMLQFCLKFAEEENICENDIDIIINFVKEYEKKNICLLNYFCAIKELLKHNYFK